jgi:hypothetical protein
MMPYENVSLDNDQLNVEEILAVWHRECNPKEKEILIGNNTFEFPRTSSDISEICTSAPLHFPNTRMSVPDCPNAGSSTKISVMMI